MTMTPLDQALEKAQNDESARPEYYEQVLNTELFLPTLEAPTSEAEATEEAKATPIIAEFDGKEYLMIFETMERMAAWAEGKVTGSLKLPGYMLVEMSTPELHWALNTGSEYQRIFVPAEIEWLKKVVSQCKEIQDIQGDGSSNT